MYFKDIYGLSEIKRTLIASVRENHVAHAQLFAGNEGSANLALALALASYVFCEHKGEYDACGHCSSCSKMDKLVHPDFHLVFPVSSTPKIAKPLSQDLLKEWREFALHMPYANISEWLASIGAESKTPAISAEESRKVVSTISLMPYESDFKILLIWLPEYLNTVSANALLKVLEEPPKKTLFFLVSQDSEKMLVTILSRLQRISVRPFEEEEIKEYLQNKKTVEPIRASQIAKLAEGNLYKALTLTEDQEEDHHILFRDWMRLCYQRDFAQLYKTTEDFAKLPKDTQKNMLQYGLNTCREALVWHYAQELVKLESKEMQFVQGFAKSVGEHNIEHFYTLLNDALLHLERNANNKIVFFDTSLQICKVIR